VLVALIAVFSKQWISYRMSGGGGLTIKHCWDRQQRCDLFEEFSGLITRAPPSLLLIALVFLVYGISIGMFAGNVVFGIIALIAVVAPSPIIGICIWEAFPGILTTKGLLNFLRRLRNNRKHGIPHLALNPSLAQPLLTIQVGSPTTAATSPWLAPEVLATIQKTNTNDIRCLLWILQYITNPEALDVTIQLVGMVLWFGGGSDVKPTYELIISIFKECLSSNGKVYTGMRDRAYYSLQAILWIHICAMHASEQIAQDFSLPPIHYNTASLDPDLKDLLRITSCQDTPDILALMYCSTPGLTSPHQQWISNALLHLSWAKQDKPETFNTIGDHRNRADQTTVPLNTILNRLLASCIFFGCPVEEVVLKIQDKSYVISYFHCSSFLYCSPPVIIWNRSYLNYPKQLP